ncbi:MAG: type VI secretion system baseplate subunit TssG, partial [Betaproteobacteria bacterium]|nr:type VI secretion system baseplate subunit TssG [Betaproteobacteria bacterium]
GTFLRFAALVRLLLDRRCDCDIELTLQAEAQPAPRLTTRTQEGQHYLGLRLGHSAWIGRVGHAPRLSARYRIPAFGSLEVA